MNQAFDDLPPSDNLATSTNSGVRTPEIEFGLCQFCNNIGMVYYKCSCEGTFFPFQNGDLQSSSNESNSQSTSSKNDVVVEVADTLAGLEINSSEPSIGNTSSEANLNIEYLLTMLSLIVSKTLSIQPLIHLNFILTVYPPLIQHPHYQSIPYTLCYPYLSAGPPSCRPYQQSIMDSNAFIASSPSTIVSILTNLHLTPSQLSAMQKV